MTDDNVAGENNNFNENSSKIDVSGAKVIISRVVNRLTFLLETTFNDDLSGSETWWALRAVDDNESAQRAVTERGEAVNAACSVVFNAMNDLTEVSAMIYPDEAPCWLKDKVNKLKSVQWSGDDLSSALSGPIDVLRMLYEGVFSRLGVVGNFSLSALFGLKTIVQDVCHDLRSIISELETGVA